jgi:hypothetical protein
MLGLTVGAIASGALVQFGPWPRDLIYLVCVGFLLLSAALIAISPEITPTPGKRMPGLPNLRTDRYLVMTDRVAFTPNRDPGVRA